MEVAPDFRSPAYQNQNRQTAPPLVSYFGGGWEIKNEQQVSEDHIRLLHGLHRACLLYTSDAADD